MELECSQSESLWDVVRDFSNFDISSSTKREMCTKCLYSDLWPILQSPNTVLMYPAADAEDIATVTTSQGDGDCNLILLDGTWAQAKAIFNQNLILKGIKKVRIRTCPLSKYVVRSQPNDSCLSTLEAAATALSILENKPFLLQVLLRPLEALCRYQIAHGAAPRQSRQYRIEHGLFTKKLKKSVMKKMAAANGNDDMHRPYHDYDGRKDSEAICDGGLCDSEAIIDGGICDSEAISDGGLCDSEAMCDGGLCDSEAICDNSGLCHSEAICGDSGLCDSEAICDSALHDREAICDGGSCDRGDVHEHYHNGLWYRNVFDDNTLCDTPVLCDNRLCDRHVLCDDGLCDR